MNLDDKNEILKINPENTIEAVYNIPYQIEQTVKDLQNLEFPEDYKKVNKIVLSGMGGSRLGGIVAQELFLLNLKVPLYVMGGYEIPDWVDHQTLFYGSSYSGNTEETLATLEEARKKTDKILIFASGGELGKIAKENRFFGYYNFDTKYIGTNPPRYSVGFQVTAFLVFLSKLGLIDFDLSKMKEAQKFMLERNNRYGIDMLSSQNLAKKMAYEVSGKIVNLVSSEHLMGVIHVLRNQFTESGKQFACYSDIPELNHFQMEGLPNPKWNPGKLMFFFAESELFHGRNQKRIEITKRVLDQNKIEYKSIKLEGKDKITQAFELLQFGSFLTYYIGILNNVNPAPQPWVDYFKNELKK